MNLSTPALFRVAAGAACWLGLTALTSAAWPATVEAPPEVVVESLYREVRRIAVKDPSPARRAWAWRALSLADDADVVDLAAQSLADPSPHVRRQMIAALQPFIKISDRKLALRARATAAKALLDAEVDVRAVAAGSLFHYGRPKDEPTEPECFLGLHDESDYVRRGCLATLHKDERGAALVEAIVHGSPTVQAWALDELETKPRFTNLTRDEFAPALEVGRASVFPEVRLRAAVKEEESREAVMRWLADPHPDVRIAAFTRHFGDVTEEDFSASIARGLLDGDPRVVAAALMAGTVFPNLVLVERKALYDCIDAGEPARVDFGAAVLHSVDTRRLAPRATFDLAHERLNEFQVVPIDSPERRRAAVWLCEFLCSAYSQLRLICPEQLPDFEAAELDSFVPYEWEEWCSCDIESAFTVGGEIVEAFTAALDDRDPFVRRAACRALSVAADTARQFGGLRAERATKLWQQIFGRIADPHVEVRRVVALQFVTAVYGEPCASPCSLAAHAAAGVALHDSDQRIQRLAARICYGGFWRPEAAPILAREMIETQTAPDDLLCPLLDHARHAIPLDVCAVAITERRAGNILFNMGYQSNLDFDWPAIRALLEADELDRWLRIVEAEPDDFAHETFRSVMSSVERSGQVWLTFDRADVDALFAFAERIDPARCELLDSIVTALARPPISRTDRIFEWTRPTAGRPALRYAVIGNSTFSESREVYSALNSNDPVERLLAMGSIVQHKADSLPVGGAAPPNFPLTPRQRILLDEAQRRAEKLDARRNEEDTDPPREPPLPL